MKRLSKKITALVLCLIFAFCSLPFTASAENINGSCGGNVTWTFDTETGLLTISGEGKMADYKSKNDVPWYAVNSYITKVVISPGVTAIGRYSFIDCENITQIDIPESVEQIGYMAFEGCNSLKHLVIPDAVMSLSTGMFWNCFELETITFGSGLQYAPATIFASCNSLEKIIVAEDNPYFCSDSDGVMFNKDKTKLIKYPTSSKIIDYTVPEGVKIIGKEAFESARNLERVVMPDSVTSIEEWAFGICQKLEKVTFGKGLTEIGKKAFSNTRLLRSVVLPDGVVSIGDGAFDSYWLKRLHIPSSVTSIGKDAVGMCAYICSDIEDCYAKTYAQENEIEFKVCTEHYNYVATQIVASAMWYRIYFGQHTELWVSGFEIPREAKWEWVADNENVRLNVSEDGLMCEAYGIGFGKTTVTAKAVDENGEVMLDWDGNEVTASVTISVRSYIWSLFLMFLNSLGINTDYTFDYLLN